MQSYFGSRNVFSLAQEESVVKQAMDMENGKIVIVTAVHSSTLND